MDVPVIDGNRALVFDDQEIPRLGFAEVLRRSSRFGFVDEAGDVTGAVRLFNERSPKLIVTMVRPSGPCSLMMVEQLLAARATTRVLVVAVQDERLVASHALRIGAHGVVNQEASSETFLSAVDRILGGEYFLTTRVMQSFVGGASGKHTQDPLDGLSRREFQVFSCLGRGLTAKEVALEVGLSAKTVEYHRQKIKDKLHFVSTSDLIRFAMQRAAQSPVLNDTTATTLMPRWRRNTA